MAATLLVGMLCVHLMCFAIIFWLINTRLHGAKLGMNAFAAGNAMLGFAYVLQLLGGSPDWDALSVVNHTLTLCVPLVFAVGALQFFDRATPLLKPVLAFALAYTVAQVLVQWLAGSVARYAMISFASAVVLLAMTDELRAAAARDPLTQWLNRRGLLAGLDTYFRSRVATPARLLMLDIDHFKGINDSHGHKAGDMVLCHMAEVLRQTLRRGDLASRTGARSSWWSV